MAVKAKRWWRWPLRIIGALLALIIVAVTIGAAVEFHGRSVAARDYPPRGALVDIGGRRMHLDCRGTGSPTVVFESGLDTNGTLAWARVQDAIASTTRACSYDRAGIMWSDPRKTPVDAEAVADDLHATLAGAGITGPLVMVGHSLGGPLMMTYVRKYGANVAGLVFVDASHPDQVARMTRLGFPDLGKVAGLFGWIDALTWTGAQRLVVQPPYPGAPASTTGATTAYMAKSLHAVRLEAEALPRMFAQGGELRTLGDRPTIVLTSTKPRTPGDLKMLGITSATDRRVQAEWVVMQAEEAHWSTRGRQILVPDASHYIQFDRPDLVIAAVDEVVGQVRGR